MFDSVKEFAKKHWEFLFGAASASAIIFGFQVVNHGPRTEEELRAAIRFYELELEEIKKEKKKNSKQLTYQLAAYQL